MGGETGESLSAIPWFFLSSGFPWPYGSARGWLRVDADRRYQALRLRSFGDNLADELVNGFGNHREFLKVNNVQIIFWCVGNLLLVHIVDEPLR